MEKKISFRKLKMEDLSLLHQWFNNQHVMEWYSKRPHSFEEVKQKYTPRIRGEQSVQCYIIECSKYSIGFIQTYILEEYGEQTAGIDVCIGEKEYLHKRLGPLIITQFLRKIVFADEKTGACIIDPEEGNKIAVKAYEKVGFQHVKMVQENGETKYIMKMYRNQIE